MYDISRRESFEKLKIWLDEVRNAKETIVIILIGNKSDLEAEYKYFSFEEIYKIFFIRRQVSIEEGEEFAKTHGLLFLETSSKTGTNDDVAFVKLSELVLEQIERGKLDPKNEVK